MKNILLIATGGTIASGYTREGLVPTIAAEELLGYVEGYREFCRVDVVQPFHLDGTGCSWQRRWRSVTRSMTAL